MNRKLAASAMTVWLMGVALAQLVAQDRVANGVEGQRELTVWLLPTVPPDADEGNVEKEVEHFNKEFSSSSGVSVYNTTVPLLRDQLVAWNPELGSPNWPAIKAHRGVLEALKRFASDQGLQIKVVFLSWYRAFTEIDKAAQRRARNEALGVMGCPDVVMIGSTWVEYFTKAGLLRRPRDESESGGLVWRPIDNKPASLRYTTDTRILLYWKRRPGEQTSVPPLSQEPKDWETILDWVERRIVDSRMTPPMVMPIGWSLNLQYDLTPLIWGNGGQFLAKDSFGHYADLTSNEALAGPELVTRKATLNRGGQLRQLVEFPEIANQEALERFVKGQYLALMAQPGAVRTWFERWLASGRSAETFWDHAGVALLPVAFKGGGDLIVLRACRWSKDAFALARFLASDEQCTTILAQGRHLPPQRKDHGVDLLLPELREHAETSQFARLVTRLLDDEEKGRELPPIRELPTEIESDEVLEAIRLLWRRMGEGDIERLKAAAKKAEQTINRKIYWPHKYSVLEWSLGAVVIGLLTSLFVAVRGRVQRIKRHARIALVATAVLRLRNYSIISVAGIRLTDGHQNSPDSNLAAGLRLSAVIVVLARLKQRPPGQLRCCCDV